MTQLKYACFALVALLAVACTDSEEAKRRFFENGNKFAAEGKFQEAIVEYRNALQQDGRFGDARFKLGEAHAAVGNQAAAFREFVRAADLLPNSDEAQIRAATYLILGGRFEDARTRILSVIGRNPANVEAQIIYGNSLAGLKDLDGAVKQIQEAIDLEPGRAPSYSNLGALELAQGNRDAANAAFHRAVEVDPRSIPAWLALANFQWSSGESDGAEASLKKALDVDAKHTLANRALAVLYMGSNRAAQAEPYLKALASSGSSQMSLQLADYYVAVRRLADATSVLQPLVQEAAVAAAAETRLARIAFVEKNTARAYGLVDSALKREPNNLQAHLLKAQLFMAEGKAREALAPAQEAVKSSPESATAHYVLGAVQDRLRMRKEAMVSFGEVLRLNPRATPAQLQLSRLSLLEGTPDAAVTYAESALAGSPQDPQARLGLVRGLLGRRDTARAETELAPLLKQFPNVASVHAADGALRLQKRELPAARAAFERALTLNAQTFEALVGVVTLDLMEGKAPQARARVEERLGAEPNRPELMQLAAQVYSAQRDYARAEATLRRAIQVDPASSRAYSMLAGVLLAGGKLDAARAEFDQMAQRDRRNLAAQTMAAMIVHSQRKTADARKRYEAIVSLDPSAAVANNNLAWIYAEEGQKLDDALRMARAAESKLPESPEVQDTIGLIYYKQELPALAVVAFEKSIDKAPDNPDYHYHLAMALQKAGNAARALTVAQQALKIKPDHADAQKLLAQLKG